MIGRAAGAAAALLLASLVGVPPSLRAQAGPIDPGRSELVETLAAARKATAEADAACRASRWAECLAALDVASRARPQHAGLLIERARVLASRDRALEAFPLLERASAMQVHIPTRVLDLPALSHVDATALARLRSRDAALARPIGERRVAFTLHGPRDMVPEGLAWDPQDRVFYLGGVHRAGILRIDANGGAKPFVAAGAQGLASTLGLRVAARARRLYVASSGLDETGNLAAEAKGRAVLLAFDLPGGRPAGTWTVADDGLAHAFGDLTLDERERPLLTDSRTGAIYRADPGKATLDVLVRPGRLASPQGLVVEPGGRTLIVADYALGLVRVTLGSEHVAPVQVPATLTTLGIDGLLVWRNTLVAVQNGVQPARVLQLRLDGDGRVDAWRILQANLEGFDEPTLATVRGDELCYVANSHWNRFEGGRLTAADQLSPPLVLRVALSRMETGESPR